MAAITKRLLHLRSTFHSHARPYPCTLHHFSSSSDRDDVPQSEQPQTQSSDSSSLNAVRASLRNLTPPPDRRQPPGSPFSFSSGETPQPSRNGSKDEISSRLAEFRYRSAPPPPHPGGQYVSLEKLYENIISSNGDSSTASSGLGAGGRQSVDYIRERMSKLHPTGAVGPGMNLSESWSVSRYTENLKNKADPNANLAGGSGNPISPFLMKGTMAKRAGDLGSRKVVYGKTHDLSSLGEKLKTMRPEKRKGKWFSLQELSDRLAKVRVADKKELERAGFHQSFQKIIQDKNQQEKDMARNYKHIGLLVSMGAETGPPKDHLVEKYFHPDNMSSAEKMKLELQKVRDEFKMSESDCGSARVQVAQLTKKIKHLSTALHKKDKHSRKGLHEMVQRRKKLLKYLRRTDWDSYCLVLSKLGLRDNPDIKA